MSTRLAVTGSIEMCFKDLVTHNESLLSRMYCMVIHIIVDVTIVIIGFLLEYK